VYQTIVPTCLYVLFKSFAPVLFWFPFKPDLHVFRVYSIDKRHNIILLCHCVPAVHHHNTIPSLNVLFDIFVFQLRNLFEMGYSLMSINKDGQTALHVASQRGDSNLVRYILANAPSNIVSVKDNLEWVLTWFRKCSILLLSNNINKSTKIFTQRPPII